MRKAIFCISGGIGYYQGYTNGELWNGWEVPYFTREEMERVRKCECIESPYPMEELDSIIIDGQEVFNFANGWVWEQHELMNPHAKVLVKDMSGRGFDWTLTAFEHAIDNIEDTELVEFLHNCEVGDSHTSDSFKTIVIE